MKNVILLLISAMVALSANAQKAKEDLTPQDPKAQELLDALSNKAKGYTSFKADFEYNLKSSDVNETQKGSVLMKGQTKYKVNVAGQEVWCDGKTVWTYIADAKEVQISDIPAENESDGNLMNPANAFHLYKKGFKYQHEGVATVDGRSVEVVKMFPINPEKKNYHTIIMNIDKAKLELVNVVVKSKDGNTYTYRLKNFQANVPVADTDFVFDLKRASDVIDLRD